MSKKVLIAVAWPYVNGDLHVGHLAGYLITSDIMARFQRLNGSDVLMISGADCHGTPITIEADKKGKTPAEIVDYYHKKDMELFKKYRLSYNLYTKTTTENHAKVVQDLFMDLMRNGFISLKSEEQFYSANEDKFLPDRYVEGTCPYCKTEDQRSDQCENCGRMIEQGAIINPKSKLSGSAVTLKQTQHYYLDLSSLQKDIQSYLSGKEAVWKNWVFAEAQGWVKEGLRPRAITRDLDWGIEIPFDRIQKEYPNLMLDRIESKKFYVWFDAVIGYLSASIEFSQRFEESKLNANVQKSFDEIIYNQFEGQSGNWKDWWENEESSHYYFMGQDNVVFHTIMWPAQLLGSNKSLHRPDNVAANKFMNYEGKKFSKSRGHIIDSDEIASEFGVDAVRFYVSANLPENKEGNFTWTGFEEAINNELVANIGNFVNRTLVFLQNKFNGEIQIDNFESNPIGFGIDLTVDELMNNSFKSSRVFFENAEFTNALNEVMKLSSIGNKLFNDSEIWNLVKTDEVEARKVMFNLMQIVVSLSILIEPFMPDSSDKLRKMLGLDELKPVVGNDQWKFSIVNSLKLTQKVEILFPKIDVSNKLAQSKVDEVKKLVGEIVIAKVQSIEKHPNADKLLVTTISDGKDVFTVVTGASNIKVDDFVPYLGVGKTLPGALLLDKKKIVLKEKDLRGVVSYGMILAEDEVGLSDKHENIFILDTNEEFLGKSLLEILSPEQVESIVNNSK